MDTFQTKSCLQKEQVRKQAAWQNTVVAHTGASCCLQSYTKTDVTKSTAFCLHLMHSTKVICLFPGWAQNPCDFSKGSGHPERGGILSTSGRHLGETQSQKTTIQVGVCRTPGVTDTESKLSTLSSSLGTKMATFLINATILFYSTLSFFSLCVPPLPTAQTQDCFGTAKIEKRKRSFKPSLTFLWILRLRILDLVWWECSYKTYRLFILWKHYAWQNYLYSYLLLLIPQGRRFTDLWSYIECLDFIPACRCQTGIEVSCEVISQEVRGCQVWMLVQGLFTDSKANTRVFNSL